jgi:dTDP-4-amino-4,6-dideoxygalactose transaminase
LNEHISQGPVTEEFEARIAEALDVPYVVATTSGSVALLMALMALGIQRGDEVIVPNRTWIATAHAALMLGANVVLVDVEPNLPIMDVAEVESKITSRTKAIIPVHMGGRAVDMDGIERIASLYGLYVIEDASQALLSRHSMGYLGTNSVAGCFSLSVAKLISTGQGGFVITKSEDTYQKLKLIRTHGVRDVINVSYDRLGFNFRFTDVQASIGIAQLGRIGQRVSHLKSVYDRYKEGLKQIPVLELIPVNVEAGELPLYVEVLCDDRERLIQFLAARSIQTRPFYPDLNTASYLNCKGVFPRSACFATRGLFLPCGPTQPLENIDRVIDVLREYK